jgi:hypothetical protein
MQGDSPQGSLDLSQIASVLFLLSRDNINVRRSSRHLSELQRDEACVLDSYVSRNISA